MIKFKQFLNEEKENEAKKKIFEIIDTMTPDEKFEFGFWLQDTFFTDDEGDDIDVDDIDDEFDIVHFSAEFIKEMIDELPSEIYPDLLADLGETDEEYEDEEEYEEDEMDESVNRIMKVQNVNRNKRKFMVKSKAQLRREISSRKKENRLNMSKRRRYYKANKQKILSYQKSREGFMDKGSHFKKLRRQG